MSTATIEDLIRQAKRHNFYGDLYAFDPGETTGFTHLSRRRPDNKVVIEKQLQIKTWPLEEGVPVFQTLFKQIPDFVVYEAYHVYAWRLDEHKFSEVPTIQIIGMLRTLCIQNGVKYGCQTAQVGKGFFKDDRLKRFGLFFEGQPHARDSLRHGLQFLAFGLKDPDT